MSQPRTSRDSSLFRDLIRRIPREHHPGEEGGVSKTVGGFSKGYLLTSKAIHLAIQEIKQKLQEACMGEERAPDKTQKGSCTKGGGMHKRLDFLSMSQVVSALRELASIVLQFSYQHCLICIQLKAGAEQDCLSKNQINMPPI